MFRTALLAILVTVSPALAQQKLINLGERRIATYCSGESAPSATVILIPAGGRTSKDWAKIQPPVSTFARVCTYDHANFGDSDKAPVKLQSVDEVVDDLHAWLKGSGERAPFILVSHSNSGFYARRFVTRYPKEVAGLVFLDSSHEEQALRLHQLDPEGPGIDDLTARLGFYTEPGERLEWRTDLPLIVLGRGLPFPRTARDGSNSQTNRMTEEQYATWDRIWRDFQKDLANRSSKGEFRLAEKSGHFIQNDQPELVIQAIRDVSRTN